MIREDARTGWSAESGFRFRPMSGRRFGCLLALAALLFAGGCASADRYSGLDPDALFQMGQEAYESRDWSGAVTALERHLSQGPGHIRNPEARMMLAAAHVERGEYILGAAEYERFLQLHPNHGSAPEASIGACRAYEALAPIAPRDQTYTRQARDACFETAQQFQGLNVALEAEQIRFRMVERLAEREYAEGRFYQRRGGHDSAILIFEDVVRRYPETQWAPMALLAIHNSYNALGWVEEASEEADRLLRLYPDSDAARELREDQGDGGAGAAL